MPIIWDQRVYQGKDIKDLNQDDDQLIDKKDHGTMIDTNQGVMEDKLQRGIRNQPQSGQGYQR